MRINQTVFFSPVLWVSRYTFGTRETNLHSLHNIEKGAKLYIPLAQGMESAKQDIILCLNPGLETNSCRTVNKTSTEQNRLSARNFPYYHSTGETFYQLTTNL